MSRFPTGYDYKFFIVDIIAAVLFFWNSTRLYFGCAFALVAIIILMHMIADLIDYAKH